MTWAYGTAVYDGSDCFDVKKYFEMEQTVLPLPTSLLKRIIIWCDHYVFQMDYRLKLEWYYCKEPVQNNLKFVTVIPI